MFTGIVESLGTIVALDAPHADALGAGGVSAPGGSRRVAIATDLPVERLPLGASIAVDGVCLTVIDRAPGRFAADLGPETLARTTLGARRVGDRVHLERPLAVGDALGGHLVAGHVDGTGVLVGSSPVGDARELQILAPESIGRFLVPKGSIAVDGVSLTVNAVEGNRFSVTLIPHTLSVTALGERPVGAPCNLEADLIAKHVDRLVAFYVAKPGARA